MTVWPKAVLAQELTSLAYTCEQGSLSSVQAEEHELISIYCLHGFSSMIRINFFLSYDHLNPHLELHSRLVYIHIVTQILSAQSPTPCAAISALGDSSRLCSVCGVWSTSPSARKKIKKLEKACIFLINDSFSQQIRQRLVYLYSLSSQNYMSLGFCVSLLNTQHFMNETCISAQATIPFIVFRRKQTYFWKQFLTPQALL